MDEAITLQLTIPGGASRIERARNMLAAEEIIMAAREKLSTLGVSLVEVVAPLQPIDTDHQHHTQRPDVRARLSAAAKSRWNSMNPAQKALAVAKMRAGRWGNKSANGHA